MLALRSVLFGRYNREVPPPNKKETEDSFIERQISKAYIKEVKEQAEREHDRVFEMFKNIPI